MGYIADPSDGHYRGLAESQYLYCPVCQERFNRSSGQSYRAGVVWPSSVSVGQDRLYLHPECALVLILDLLCDVGAVIKCNGITHQDARNLSEIAGRAESLLDQYAYSAPLPPAKPPVVVDADPNATAEPERMTAEPKAVSEKELVPLLNELDMWDVLGDMSRDPQWRR
jgi:hypothetical protein